MEGEEKVTYTKADLFYQRMHDLRKAALEFKVNKNYESWLLIIDAMVTELCGFLRKETKEMIFRRSENDFVLANEDYFVLEIRKLEQEVKKLKTMPPTKIKTLKEEEINDGISELHRNIVFMINRYHLDLPKGKMQGGKDALEKAFGVFNDTVLP
jgi:hypothetical protein